MEVVFKIEPDVMVSARLVEIASQYPNLQRVEFTGRAIAGDTPTISLTAQAWYGAGLDNFCISHYCHNVDDLLTGFQQKISMAFMTVAA